MSPLVQRINSGLRRIPVWPFYIIGFIPAGWLLWRAINNQLGADPVAAIEHDLGKIGLQFLIAALLVTPICQMFHIGLYRFRRMIGLMGFYYVCLHLLAYLWLDRQFLWSQITADLTKRPYIIIGMIGVLALLPLAVTSNDWSIRKLGTAAWKRLHKLAYLATFAGAVHYVWLVKAWPLEPLIYLLVVVLLILYRPARKWWKRRRRVAQSA